MWPTLCQTTNATAPCGSCCAQLATLAFASPLPQGSRAQQRQSNLQKKIYTDLGISQASFVENDEQFSERVQFIHDKFDGDVIAEEYIEGREFYVSVLGNHRLRVFPIRELVFKEVPPDEPKIATCRAKWDEEYR